MSFRSELQIHTYTTLQLAEIVGTKAIVINVSGIPIDVQTLVSAGWSCRIAHSVWGGRSKISFYGADRRSYITFRTPNQFREYSALALFELLAEQTAYQGKLSTWPKPLQKIPTDEEMLTQVEANIKRRLSGRKRRTMVDEDRLNRFVEVA